MSDDLLARFGPIDIYWFDQLLKGRVARDQKVLDAGCGSGRNLVYLLRAGYPVYGADREPAAIDAVRTLAAELAPELPAENFRAEPLEALSFPPESFGTVLVSAVLHFARDEEHFAAMLEGCWRQLAPGGMLLARLTSTIGIEGRSKPLGGRRFLLPDGSERFLVDEAHLAAWEARLGATRIEPLKTTVVERLRSMTTWAIRKGG